MKQRTHWNYFPFLMTMGERSKGKHKSYRMKVWQAEKVREYFINPEIENDVFA